MPLMDGNLKEYLRGEGPFKGKDTANGLKAMVEGKLYKQVIGLVGALHHMVHTIKMHRVDLKPDNILVKREQDGRGNYNDIFILADFGQARVKRSKKYTKTGMGVTFAHAITDAYAPPEAFQSAWGANFPISVQEDKWDIWPLGCIFVEILTLLALGQQGVHKLDQERETKFAQGLQLVPEADLDMDPDTNSNSDCRFWVTEPSKSSRSGQAPTLKQSIKQWLSHLEYLTFGSKEIDAVTRTKCKDFMAWNIRLTTAMLNPWPSTNISTRCSIGDIVTWMRLELLAGTDESLITPMDTATLDRLLGFRVGQIAKPEAPAAGSTPKFPWPDMQTSPKSAPISTVPRILEPGNNPQETWAPEAPPTALQDSNDDGSPKTRSSIDSETSTLDLDIPNSEQRPEHAAPGADDMHNHGERASLSESFSLGPGLFDSWPELGADGTAHA